jgi:hypothetical protein
MQQIIFSFRLPYSSSLRALLLEVIHSTSSVFDEQFLRFRFVPELKGGLWGLSWELNSSHICRKYNQAAGHAFILGASERIPNPRHRAKTALPEQSIRFPSCNLTSKRKLDRPFVMAVPLSHYQQHKSGSDKCLVKLDHLSALYPYDAKGGLYRTPDAFAL